MSDGGGAWIGWAILLAALFYVQHLEKVDCRNRGGEPVTGFLEVKCKGAKP